MNAHAVRALIQRKNLAPAIVVLLFSLVIFFGVASSTAQSPAKEERKIETRIPAHLPIKVEIKNIGKVKDLKNEDWISDLEVEVTNTGTKPIYYLYIESLLPDVITDEQSPTKTVGFALRYGRPQLVDLTEPLESDDVPIKPGESTVLKINSNNAVGWKSLRAKGRYMNPKKLQFWFEGLNFGDGTGFNTPEGLPVSVRKERSSSGSLREGGALAYRQTTHPLTSPPLSLDSADPFFFSPARFLTGDFFNTSASSSESTSNLDICCDVSRWDCSWLKRTQDWCLCDWQSTSRPRAVLIHRRVASRQNW
jgi:hypothetical protein